MSEKWKNDLEDVYENIKSKRSTVQRESNLKRSQPIINNLLKELKLIKEKDLKDAS